MRSDVKTLLEKLGKSQFRYKEFSDRFSDLDTWPVFESIVRDPRVLNSGLDSPASSQKSPNNEVASIGVVLSQKYGDDAHEGAKANVSQPAADVRTLLARISGAVETGAI